MAEWTNNLHVNHGNKTNDRVSRTRVHDCDKNTRYLISSVSPVLGEGLFGHTHTH